MGQWEPMADHIPLDVRRLATQLRRMKDRSGLTVPGLAARTAQSAETWALALAARHVPPLDAVEVLAQVSGADYDRIGALWKLAYKAAGAAGAGEPGPGSGPGSAPGPGRGRGKPVPYPDPLDPLGADEGRSGRRRRFLLPAATAVLAAAALTGVMLTAGASTGRAPRHAGPPPSVSVAPPESSSPGHSAISPGGAPSRGPAPVPGGGAGASGGPGGTDAPPTARVVVPPAGAATATFVPGTASTPAPAPTAAPGGTPSSPPVWSPPPSSPPPSAPEAGPTPTGVCLDVILRLCVG
jgi:hypothetical protein